MAGTEAGEVTQMVCAADPCEEEAWMSPMMVFPSGLRHMAVPP